MRRRPVVLTGGLRSTVAALPRLIPTMLVPAFQFAALVLAVTPGPGVACTVACARLRSRVPRVTMLGRGAYLALARRGA